jgi:hypothetical protein
MVPLLDPLLDGPPLEPLDPPLLEPAGAPLLLPLLLLDTGATPELEELPAVVLLLEPVGEPLDPAGAMTPLELPLPPPSDLSGSPGSAAQARPRQVAPKARERARRGLP